MSSVNVPGSGRSPNRSQRVDTVVEYEVHPGELAHDTGFFVSRDGKRGTRIGLNVGLKKRKVKPSDLVDAYGDWVPLNEQGDEERGGDEEEDAADTGGKRKRNKGSDEPMKAWRLLMQRFLDEMLRREGLGNAMHERGCSCCKIPWDSRLRRFRCRDCGVFVQCMDCVLERHRLTPLHKLQEWKGNCWVPSTLESLGSVYQLGHGGHPCQHPAPAVRTMVILDTPLRISSSSCGTTGILPLPSTLASLDLFRLLNVVGNINVHDFVGALEQSTNACDVKGVPDRYKAFGLMARQHAFLTRLKRAGRAHDPAGIRATKNGECAVQCWCCPHDEINLPEGWWDVAPEYRFLYMMLLAMDANFRLRHRLRANEHEDRPLGSGWGHLVEDGPYKEHLKGYVAEKDVSTCIAFAALLQKDTRLATGLRASGVGGVVCARHEVVRPQGVGDLQKGERYSNMDYILLSSILGITAMYLAISYDIACQWKLHFPARMSAMPEHMRLDLSRVKLLYGLPVWHAAAHERKCQVQNSLSYIPGVGRTDGEGIERTWSGFNPLAWATKEMTSGARADVFEDKIDHHNFLKNVNQGTTLPRKLILAMDERNRRVAAFKEVDGTLKKELRRKWQKQINEWIKDSSKPNPYELENGKDGGPSEAAIRLSLVQEEAKEAATGGGKLHGSSVTSFLTAGLQLEETQRRIRMEVKGRTLIASDQSERITEMRRAFFSKLARFRKLQEVYMAAAVRELEQEEDSRDAELPPPKAEDVKLYLPSGLRTADREDGSGKDNVETRLSKCEGGFMPNDTSSPTEIQKWQGSMQQRVRIPSLSMSASVWMLQQPNTGGRLKASDIQLDEEREVDARVRRKLGNIGSKRSRRLGGGLSSKERTFSWIWTEGGGPGENEEELHDCNTVEWSKAKARKQRWEEEVELLREEMKRALQWETRTLRTEGVTPELRAGLEAYAARQAAIHREIARSFKQAWERSATTSVRIAVHDDAAMAEGMSSFGRLSAEGFGSEGVSAEESIESIG
ncbi:hypothetical protein DFH07DRAFT_952479 [Mycena maculata]|uniref:CxC2-like cysteine cluster KDZ transposase-associated domain-containing protein n=1 Tax=Mycena maculata TaxID=230809 RepID=A0AAD7JXX5_9AGAR|nr:hypothetical protein DFH07DRAFT_952479 [Mycena maculata]